MTTPLAPRVYSNPTAPDVSRSQRECNEDPLCFNGQWSFLPSFNLGYEALLGAQQSHHVSAGLKLLLMNREHWAFGHPRGEHSFGIGPDLRAFGGDTREGGSLGINLRYLRIPDWSEFIGFMSWGLDFSIRGGIGTLNTHQSGINYQGEYQFFAADVTLFASLLFLTLSVGAGIRGEFWPEGRGSTGASSPTSGPHLFPAFTLGIGGF